MQQEYPLHCEPLSSLRSHSTSSPCHKSSLLSIPAVCWSGREPHQKVLVSGTDIDWVDGGEGILCQDRVGVFWGGQTGLYVQVWASSLLMNWRESVPLNPLVRVALCSSLHPSLLPSTSLRPPPPACKPPPVFPGRWAPRRRRPTRD